MKHLSLILIILLLILTSCTREFNSEISFEKQVVVNSVLVAGGPVIVGLHFSIPVNETENSFNERIIENAYVEISDTHGNNYILDTTSEYEIYPPLNGIIEIDYYNKVYYTDQLIPEERETYFLKVYVPGYDTIYAKTTIPVSADTGRFWYKINYAPFRKADVWLELKNYGDVKYYWLQIADMTNVLQSQDPATITTNYFSFINGELFSNQNYTLHFQAFFDTAFQDTAVFYLFRVNEEFAYYFKSYWEQFPSEIPNPYREPVVVYSNIKNGIGIFTSFSKPIFLKIPLKSTRK